MMLKWMWTFRCVLYADFTFYEERRQVTEETCSKGSKVKLLYNCGKTTLHILKWGYSQSPLVKELWATTLLDVDSHWLKCEGHVVVHTGRFTLSYRSSTLIYFLVALQWTIIIHVHPFNDDEKVLFFFLLLFLGNLLGTLNSIIHSDNFDVKFHYYCNFQSLQLHFK